MSSDDASANEIQAIFNAITDGMLRFDKDLVITAVNRTEAAALGLDPSQIIGKRCQDLYHETIEGCPLCNLWDPLETGECLTSYDTRLPSRTPNGLVREHVDLHFYPIVDNNDEIAEIVVQIRDIADRKRLEAALNQAERLTALGGWITGVAHELNNPLTGILGNTELALEEASNPKVRRALEVIRAEAERMREILGTLLTFSGKRDLRVEPVNLHSVIERIILLRSADANASGVTIEPHLCADLGPISGVGVQLQQVILNLIGNAIDAVASTGRPGTIYVTTRVDGDQAVVEVRDDGPGIPEDLHARIFEPFFTTKKTGAGTGLGLSISETIVARHGGTLTVASRPGEGATFQVCLPKGEESPQER